MPIVEKIDIYMDLQNKTFDEGSASPLIAPGLTDMMIDVQSMDLELNVQLSQLPDLHRT